MKKKFMLIGLLSLSMTTAVISQDDTKERINFGLKAGLNYSNVWDGRGEEFEADSKFGFAGGAFLGIPFGEFLGFQPELLISQKGMQASGILLGTTYSYTKTLTYIDVPLQLQLRPADFMTILVGPQYSYLMNEKSVYTFGANSVEQEQEFENDNIRKNVLGFVAGADINISHIVVSGRLGWDFQTNHGDGSSSTPRYKNRWVQLTIGFRI